MRSKEELGAWSGGDSRGEQGEEREAETDGDEEEESGEDGDVTLRGDCMRGQQQHVAEDYQRSKKPGSALRTIMKLTTSTSTPMDL